MAGAVERVRPKMMTVVAIMAGLLPIMWSHGTGAEVMQRIAVPMIGGMVSSTVLTLIVIPVIYTIVKGAMLRPSRLIASLQSQRANLGGRFMMYDMMSGWGMAGMGLIGILVLVVLILSVGALIKYLFSK